MFYNFKKILKEEKEEVILSPEQYLTILSSMNYRSDFVQNLAPFKNKKIIINGSLRIQSLPIKKLNDLHIEGSLMATDSQLENIDGTEIDGGFYYTNTPFQKILLEKLKQEEQETSSIDRLNNTLFIEDLYETEELNGLTAIYNYFLSSGKFREYSDDQKLRIKEIRKIFENQINPSAELIRELSQELEEISLSVGGDIYDFKIISGYFHSILTVKCTNKNFYGEEYKVGTEYEFNDELKEYWENYLRDNLMSLDESLILRYLDVDAIKYNLKNQIEDEIREYPADWELKYELDSWQEQRIKELNHEIYFLEMEEDLITKGAKPELKLLKNSEKNVLEYIDGNNIKFKVVFDPFFKIYINNSEVDKIPAPDLKDMEYYEDDVRSKRLNLIGYHIDKLNDEIQEIELNPEGPIDESDLSDKVDKELDKIDDNPIQTLKDRDLWGYSDLSYFIELDDMARDYAEDGDYYVLSSDNYHFPYDIDRETYIVIRVSD